MRLPYSCHTCDCHVNDGQDVSLIWLLQFLQHQRPHVIFPSTSQAREHKKMLQQRVFCLANEIPGESISTRSSAAVVLRTTICQDFCFPSSNFKRSATHFLSHACLSVCYTVPCWLIYQTLTLTNIISRKRYELTHRLEMSIFWYYHKKGVSQVWYWYFLRHIWHIRVYACLKNM